MKANDFIQVLEYLKTFQKTPEPVKKKRHRREEYSKAHRIIEVLRELDEIEEIQKKLKDKHKPKEDKKDKDGLTIAQKTFVLTILGPPLGIAYIHGMLVLAQHLSTVVR